MATTTVKETTAASQEIDTLCAKALKALEVFKTYTQEQVDKITKAMCDAGVANERSLAEFAVEETGIGNVEDKVIKNHFGSQVVYDYMKDKKSVQAAKIMLDAAVAAGAPKDCIQWITQPSVEATNALMTHPDVSIIVATGGGAMVKAAYSSGHPALGVGPGGVPIVIEKSANLDMATTDVIASKTFDNGTICSSDQSVIFDDKATCDKALKMFEAKGAYLCTPEEKAKLEKVMFDKERGVPSMYIVGKSPQVIGALAGLNIPADRKMLLVPLDSTSGEDWMSHEKLSPVLGWYVAKNTDEAINAAAQQLDFGGAGHSAGIFTADEKIAEKFAMTVHANRVMWNQPSVHGTIGALYNSLVPSLTLGCGTAGGNITSENVGYKNLLNIKRLARRKA